jgi:hypothetical protein
MTPFEQAEENRKFFMNRLTMLVVLMKTIEDTQDLEEQASDDLWLAILMLLETRDFLKENN